MRAELAEKRKREEKKNDFWPWHMFHKTELDTEGCEIKGPEKQYEMDSVIETKELSATEPSPSGSYYGYYGRSSDKENEAG